MNETSELYPCGDKLGFISIPGEWDQHLIYLCGLQQGRSEMLNSLSCLNSLKSDLSILKLNWKTLLVALLFSASLCTAEPFDSEDGSLLKVLIEKTRQ